MGNVIYVAVSKQSGKIMSGVRGQTSFADKNTLNKSLAYAYGKGARQKYDIVKIDVDRYIDFTGDAIDG